MTFEQRFRLLNSIFNITKFKHIVFVETTYQNRFNLETIEAVHSKFVKEGYEGSIIRSSLGIYESGKRSFNLLKKKDFVDEDYKIIGYYGSSKRVGKRGVQETHALRYIRRRGTYSDD